MRIELGLQELDVLGKLQELLQSIKKCFNYTGIWEDGGLCPFMPAGWSQTSKIYFLKAGIDPREVVEAGRKF